MPDVLRPCLPDRFVLPVENDLTLDILINPDGEPSKALKEGWRQNILQDRPSLRGNQCQSVRGWLTMQQGGNLLGKQNLK